jgi:hypothetical protein
MLDDPVLHPSAVRQSPSPSQRAAECYLYKSYTLLTDFVSQRAKELSDEPTEQGQWEWEIRWVKRYGRIA